MVRGSSYNGVLMCVWWQFVKSEHERQKELHQTGKVRDWDTGKQWATSAPKVSCVVCRRCGEGFGHVLTGHVLPSSLWSQRRSVW